MEIGDDPTAVDAEGLDPQIARIIGMTGGALGDDSVRMAVKVLDFAVCQTILERTFETFPLEMQELPWLRGCPPLDFSVSYLAKFWCSLAWIEQVRFFYPVRNMLHNLIMFQIYRRTGLT